MAPKAKKRRQARQKVSAKETAAKNSGDFELSTITIPDGVRMFRLKNANTRRIDVIPFAVGKGNPNADEGMLHFERTYYTHQGIGPDSESYVCPAKTYGGKCPICEARAKLASDPDADPDGIKELLPKKRTLWNVFDHGDPEAGVQIWEISHFFFGKQLYAEIASADDDDGYEYFADPDDGMTLRLGIEENNYQGRTSYKVASINFKARQPLDEEILDAATCLDDIIKVLEYDALNKLYLQLEDDDEDDEDEETPPRKKRRAAKKKPAPEPEEDDEDGDEDLEFDENDEEDEEETPPPKKKRPVKKKAVVRPRKKKKAPVVEDDDDDEENEEDEDEETPPPKKKRTPKGKRPAKKKPEPEEDEDEEDEDDADEGDGAEDEDDWDDWD